MRGPFVWIFFKMFISTQQLNDGMADVQTTPKFLLVKNTKSGPFTGERSTYSDVL